MSIVGYLVFVCVYALAVASPGPGVAAVVARALSGGFSGALPFIAGVALGDLVWLWLTAAGLGVVAERYQPVFAAIRWAGVAYLLWLAIRLWRAEPPDEAATAPGAADAGSPPAGSLPARSHPARSRPAEPSVPAAGEGWRAVLGGLSMTLGNPKVMVFFLAILPNLFDVGRASAATVAAASATIAVVLPAVLSVYALAADRARRLLASARARRRVNRASAALMAGAALAVAAK